MNNLERRLPWIIIALAAAAGIAGYVASSRLFVADTGAVAQPRQLQASLLYPQPKPLPDFTLQRSDGSVLVRKDWTGRWRLLFFGFASCPDVCPTALATAKAARAQLRTQRPDLDLAVSFVSVDPERDTPQRLAEYAPFFHPSLIGVTGTPEQIAAVARMYGSSYRKQPKGPEGNYAVDHSSVTYIIGADGKLAEMLQHGSPPESITAAINKALATAK